MLKFHRYFWGILGIVIGLSYKSISLLLLISGLAGWIYPPARKVILRHFTSKRMFRDPLSGMLVIGVIFWIWMLLSAFWSPPGGEVARNLAITFLLISATIGALALAASLPRREVGKTHQFILIGLTIGFGVLCIEAVTGSMLRQTLPPAESPYRDVVATSRGLTTMLAFLPGLIIWALPGLMSAERTRRYYVLVFCAVFYGVIVLLGVQLDVFANLVAIVLLPVLCLLGGRWPKAMIRALGGMAAIAFLFSPFIAAQLDRLYTPLLNAHYAGNATPDLQIISSLHRLVIWDFSAEIILDDPLGFVIGAGAHAADNFSARAPQYEARIENIRQTTGLAALPTHPHNLYLEIWLELGLIGVLLSILLLYHLAKYLDRWLRADSTFSVSGAAIVGMYFLFLLHASVEMSLWREWRISMMSMGVFFVILSVHRSIIGSDAAYITRSKDEV